MQNKGYSPTSPIGIRDAKSSQRDRYLATDRYCVGDSQTKSLQVPHDIPFFSTTLARMTEEISYQQPVANRRADRRR